MNNVCLIGRITKDIELKTTGSGISNCRFTIAVNRTFKDANGERQADFINCVAWRTQADFLNNYCKKGNQISIIGNIQTGSYTNNENQTIYTTDVIVSNVALLEKKEEATQHIQEASAPNNFNINDDDLPF